MIQIQKEFLTLPIDKVIPYENNPRVNDIAVNDVVASIRQCENIDPIEVDENNIILSGHTRLKALKALDYTEVQVLRITGLTDEQKRKYRILANKTAEKAEWDFEKLELELDGLDFEGYDFGFDVDLSNFEQDGQKEVVEDDYNEEPPAEPKAKLGDLYQLGQHRLICGDSTDVNVINRLMNGVKADMVFTDPPFGVNAKGGKDKGNMIMGDLTQTAIPFSFEIAVTKCTKDKAHFYFCGAEANIQLYQKLFDRYLHILPKHLIWVKNGFVMKQAGYHNQFEIIFHGYKQGSGGLWYGGRTEDEASDVWHIKRDAPSAYLHPTQKPIGVPARAIKNSCPPSGSVVDLFGGSGSTLIACEQLNRKCYMCELEPKYIDVIIDRWEKFTGEKAVLLNG